MTSTYATLSPADQERVSQFGEAMARGIPFSTAAASHTSRDYCGTYQAPINAYTYSQVIQDIGRMAAEGDRFASLAAYLLPRVPLHGTQGQVCAAIFTAMGEFTSRDWKDVLGATGPEASRPSAHRHAWKASQKAVAYAWAHVITRNLSGSVPAYGWCLTALAERDSIYLPTIPRH